MKLSAFLAEKNLAAAHFARECGISKQRMFRYVHAQAMPSAKLLSVIKLKSGGQVTADDFAEAYNDRTSQVGEAAAAAI